MGVEMKATILSRDEYDKLFLNNVDVEVESITEIKTTDWDHEQSQVVFEARVMVVKGGKEIFVYVEKSSGGIPTEKQYFHHDLTSLMALEVIESYVNWLQSEREFYRRTPPQSVKGEGNDRHKN